MKIVFKKQYGSLLPYSQDEKDKIDKLKDGAVYEVDVKNLDMRTIQQNKLIHVFCKNVSDSLNNSGLYLNDVIRYETQWSMQKAKDLIFRPVMKQLYDKDSTTKLDKKELNDIFDSVIKALASKKIDTSLLLSE